MIDKEQKLQKQLEFLKKQGDREDMARSRYHKENIPMTGSACPGCGEEGPVMSYSRKKRPQPNRLTDGVCTSCRRILVDGINARLQELESTKDRKIYQIDVCGYYEGHHSREYVGGEPKDLRQQLEDRMLALIKMVSEPIREALHDIYGCDAPPYLPSTGSNNYGSRTGRDVVLLYPAVAQAIENLDIAIREALKNTSDAAKAHGVSLLAQLAAGEVTINQFNEASLPEFVPDEDGKRKRRRR